MFGTIFDIKRFAVHDGPGIRTTVFMKGCPLRCSWCHNPESIEKSPSSVSKILKLNGRSFTKEETIGYEISTGDLYAELEKERTFMDESGGGVTFSGGEPMMQHDFLMEMLKICKKNGIHTTVDTSLYASWEKIEAVSMFTDLFLVDLKIMDSKLHRKYTGVDNVLILENIRKLSVGNASIIIRIPLIPKVSATVDNIGQTISFLQTLNGITNVDLLPFHNRANEKYKRMGKENQFGHMEPLLDETIKNIENQFIKAGFKTKRE